MDKQLQGNARTKGAGRRQANRPRPNAGGRRLRLEQLEQRALLDAGPLLITEFLARNDSGIYDDWNPPKRQDWIEIYNPTQEVISLDGWYLTDSAADLRKCRFPAVTLGPGEYLLVFASGRASGSTMVFGPGGRLHTNFALATEGEFLALVRPDGTTIASSFAPQYPPQVADVSYGWSMDLATQGYFALPTPGTGNTDEPMTVPRGRVLINEIMFNTARGTPGSVGFEPERTELEFVELYNKESIPLNLQGWQLDRWWFATEPVKPVSSITSAGGIATVTLPAHGYADGDSVLITGAEQPEYNGVFAISNVTANTFQYSVPGAPPSPATGVITAQRHVRMLAGITRENLVATATLPNHGYSVGDTVLLSGAEQPEYNGVFVIESATADSFSFTVQGLPATPATGTILVQRASASMPDVTIAARGYLVIAGDGKAFHEKYPTVANYIAAWTPRLSNGGEQLVLRNAAGDVVDRVRYFDQGDWAVRTKGEKLVASLVRNGATVTVTLPYHGYGNGSQVRIAGADQPEYNGTFTIANVTRDTFTYTIAGTPTSPATGTIYAQLIDHGHVGWVWDCAADGNGMSLELISTTLSNNYGQNWGVSLTAGGTPGRTNSIAAADIAPVILDVQHFPVIPSSAKAVTVTARILDELVSGVTAAVYYRIDGAPMFTAAVMYDDGLHGDGAAGDRVFGAVLPPQPNGTIVEFYLWASDASGRVRTWPAPNPITGERAALLYQVDDSFDPAAPWTPGAQPVFRLVMTAAERAELADIGAGGGDQDSNAMMNATLIVVDGTGPNVRYNVGVRNRGHGSRVGPPNNFHVNIPHDRPWNDLVALNFNCRAVHAQALGAAVYQMAGFAVPDLMPVQLRINNVNPAVSGNYQWGTYGLLEAFNGDFLDRHIPDDPDGNLYSAFRADSSGNRDADLRYEGENPNVYRNRYFKENHEEQDDWSDLIHMLYVLNNAPEATYFQDVSEVVNVEQWVRYLALDSLIINYETTLTTGVGDDYFMYRGAKDPRFILVPHDLDTTFGLGSPPINLSIFAVVDGYPPRDGSSNGIEGLQRFLNHPDILPLYYKAFVDLIDTVFNPAVINPLVDQVLGAWVPESNRNAIKQFVVNRANAVLAQIPRQYTIDCSLPVVDGFYKTSADTAVLSGTADVTQTRSVRVAGLPAQWDPKTGQWLIGGTAPPSDTRSFQEGINGYLGTVDTHIRQASPNTSYENAAVMVDGEVTSGQRDSAQGLIRFENIFGDQPWQIPFDGSIASASLVLNVTNASSNVMSLHRLLVPWTETATWAGSFGGDGVQPDGLEALSLPDATFTPNSTGKLTIDVTASLLAWKADPSRNFGWVILPSGTDGMTFDCSETGTAANRPQLIVKLGDTNTISMVFQEGFAEYTGTLDTAMEGANPNTSFATATVLRVDGQYNGFPAHGLLRFENLFGDGPNQIRPDDQIVSATLSLNVTDAGNTISLHRMLQPWNETDTWNTWGGGIQADGVEAAATADATLSASSTGKRSADVTTSLRAWQTDPASNFGWALLPGGSDGVRFNSKEIATLGNRPELRVVVRRGGSGGSGGSGGAGGGSSGSGGSAGSGGLGVPLLPGINRVVVEAFDQPDGRGNLVYRGYVDIWCDRTTDTPELPPLADPPGLCPDPQLKLLVRDSYLPGVPILVRAEITDSQHRIDRDRWNATVTLSTDNPNVQLSATEVTLYNGIGSALVTVSGSEPFTLTASWADQSVSKPLSSLLGQPITTVSGTLAGDDTWSGIVRITGDLTVPSGTTLTVMPGTLVLLDGVASGSDGVDIDVLGRIQSLGTAHSPVTFTAYNPALAWGEIHHSSAAPSVYHYTEVMRAGRSPGAGHTGTGPAFRIDNSTVVFENCSITDTVGKTMQSSAVSDVTFRRTLLARSVMGPELAGTQLLFDRSFIQHMHYHDDADGIYVHDQRAGQSVVFRGGGVAMVDDDCIDTLGATVLIDDMVLRGANDKGVSVYNGQVTITRCLIVENSLAPEDGSQAAVSSKGTNGSTVTVNIDRTTIINDHPAGIGIQGRNKYGYPDVHTVYNVTNSIILAYQPAQIDAPYDPNDIHISFSAISTPWTYGGSHDNITADPLLFDPAGHDYRLRPGSPCIDAGDPAGVPDPDGTRADLGYRPLDSNGTYAPRIIYPGHITTNTLMYAGGGPYRVTGDVTVDPGVTLTIAPGTTVFFDPGARLTVNGRLRAVGTAQKPIRLTVTPGGGVWDGVHLLDTTEDNRIAWAIIEYGEGLYSTANPLDRAMVAATNSTLLLEHSTLDHARYRRLRTVNSSLVVRNCLFTDMFGPGESPLTNNHSEQVWGTNATVGGQILIEGNTFGTTKGHNDIIDLKGGSKAAGEPVPQIIGNVFLGGGDDALDLEGDFLIEGNIFQHFHKDPLYHTGEQGESNVISAGGSDLEGCHYVVARNVFYDVDHAVLVKDRSTLEFLNNTVVNVAPGKAAIYFDVVGDSAAAGRGAVIDSSIFWDVPVVFDLTVRPGAPSPELSVTNSILPQQWHGYGTGNTAEDPRLSDPAAGSFRLLPGSPALATGPNGLDRGALVPGGATITGQPEALTGATSATLTVGGVGITHYKYRLNDGPWSDELPVWQPLALTGLGDGTYTVYVLGKNYAGVWQSEAAATASKTWVVDTSRGWVRINEVLAINRQAVEHAGRWPDMIELYNPGAVAVSLAGMAVTDDPTEPEKFVFPDGLTIGPGEYLVLYADDRTDLPGIHLGFALDGDSDRVLLLDTAANRRAVLDSVQFGPQAPDLSIGRVGHDAQWTLTVPTLGGPNRAARTGNPATLRINEWLADGQVRLVDDFVELYNPDPLPVPLEGLYLTDNPQTQPAKHRIGPLSYVAGGGFVAFKADGQTGKGFNHLGFRISANQEWLALCDAQLRQIDKVLHFSQTTDYSQGRSPDGAAYPYAFFALPTPGVSNAVPQRIAALDAGLRITEVMYHPAEDADYEYIELANVGAVPLDLGGVRLSGGIEFSFPEMILAPGEYVLAVRDLGAFYHRYGPGANVAGQYSGNLDNSGEQIALQLPAPYDAAILRFQYSNLWYPETAGQGRALVSADPLLPPSTWSQPSSWLPGGVGGGSPGRADGQSLAPQVIISEVLAHTDPPLVDAVELHNLTDQPIDITGWYLSDSLKNLKKYRVPAEKGLIPAGGFAVFTESDFNPNPQNPDPNDFSFNSAYGDQVWLAAADAVGNITLIVDYVEFGPTANGETVARFTSTEGRWYVYPAASRTLGSANTAPRVGPQVVITELMYCHALTRAADDLEYIELYNPTAEAIDLAHWSLGTGERPWENLVLDFSTLPVQQRTIQPGQTLVVLSFDPWDAANAARWQKFRTTYGISDTEPIGFVGGYSGHFSDSGELVRLHSPDSPQANQPGYYPPLAHDELRYRAAWGAYGTGESLHRVALGRWGDEPQSWIAAAPSPGRVGAVIVGQYIFYNNSALDGRTPGADPQDQHAIATDKVPLRRGQVASLANYTSYVWGINGIIIDVAHLANPAAFSAETDLRLRVGNNSDPQSWQAAPAPLVAVTPGGAPGGADRITLIWQDGQIQNQWIEVTVKATANTGLYSEEVFYFGNCVGETGNDPSNAEVTEADAAAVRANRTGIVPAAVTNPYDFNRDRRVNSTDEMIARNNPRIGPDALQLIDLRFLGGQGLIGAQGVIGGQSAIGRQSATGGQSLRESSAGQLWAPAVDALLSQGPAETLLPASIAAAVESLPLLELQPVHATQVSPSIGTDLSSTATVPGQQAIVGVAREAADGTAGQAAFEVQRNRDIQITNSDAIDFSVLEADGAFSVLATDGEHSGSQWDLLSLAWQWLMAEEDAICGKKSSKRTILELQAVDSAIGELAC